jgi:flagellar hook-associated protein 3 FlgL
MRITNNMIQSQATSTLQLSLQRMAEANTQVSSGQRYQTFAENPQVQSNVMQTSGALRALDQYKRNVADAQARGTAEDSVLDQLSTTLDRAKQIAIQQGTATSTEATRAGAKAEVDNLLDFVVGLGNTKYIDGYLFGGDDVTTAPVTNTPPFYDTAAPPSGEHTTQIAAGQLFKSNHNAKELLLDTNVLQALKSLSDGLGANDMTQIKNALDSIDSATSSVQGLVGDLGARMNQLEVTSANLDALSANLTTFKSNLSEIDYEEAMTALVSRQTAYQSAMLATSRVIGMTLTDYLR